MSDKKLTYLYQVSDRFGDNGIVAVLIVSLEDSIPVVEEFAMSCRVMGKYIEYAIIDDLEHDLKALGFKHLRGIYLPTPKNKPVARFWGELGYQKYQDLQDGGIIYEIKLSTIPQRKYYVEKSVNKVMKTRKVIIQ